MRFGAVNPADEAATAALRAACASRRRTIGLTVPGTALRGWALDGLHAQALQGNDSHWQDCDFAGARLDAACLRNARLEACTLVGSRWIALDASGLQAPGSDWAGAVVEDSRFDGAALVAADFSAAWLTDSRFDRAQLDGARFDEAQADGVSLRGASAVGARFAGARLAGADFRGADLRDAVFSMAQLEGADFRGATLDGACFDGARRGGARFDATAGAAGARPPPTPGDHAPGGPSPEADRLEALLATWLAAMPQGPEAAREPMALLGALLRRAGLPGDVGTPAPTGADSAAGAALAPLLNLLGALESGQTLPADGDAAAEAQWQALAGSLFPDLADAPERADWEALAQRLATLLPRPPDAGKGRAGR
jgi:uncharacterized protein YjbI with pentapeptide repeats